MSIKIFNDVAEQFLRSAECRVLAIKGDWGVGKTYAWQRLTESVAGGMWPQTYSYVSLFGATSIGDVRSLMLSGMKPAETLNQKLSFEILNDRWWTLLKSRIGTYTSRFRRTLNDYDVGKHVSVGLDTITPWITRNMIVCLDDFERVSEKLSHDELMGFISSLKETAGCKVVIILNDEKLPPGENYYRKYREKVIDLELTFAPTMAEATDWGLPIDLPLRDIVAQSSQKLRISNVRILKKIAAIVSLLAEKFGGVRPDVQREAVLAAIVLGWAFYDRSGNAPSTDFLKSWNSYVRLMDKSKKQPETSEEEEAWASRLNDFGFVHFDELDGAVLTVIEHGYIQGSGFEAQAHVRSRLYEKGDLEQSFRGAWEKFHESFDYNADEVVNALNTEARRAISILNPSDLVATVTLLRQLQRDDLADQLIEFFIQERQSTPEIFDLDANPFGGDVTDPTLRAAFKKRNEATVPTVTLREAVEAMVTNQSWSNVETRALERATVDDFYHLFKGPLSVRRRRAIDACFRVGASPNSEVTARVMESLRRIAEESPINRMRLRGVVDQENHQGARPA